MRLHIKSGYMRTSLLGSASTRLSILEVSTWNQCVVADLGWGDALKPEHPRNPGTLALS